MLYTPVPYTYWKTPGIMTNFNMLFEPFKEVFNGVFPPPYFVYFATLVNKLGLTGIYTLGGKMVKVSRKIAIVNLIFFTVMIAINYYAGSNVGIKANENSALIQPAGYAFSIWILIYCLLFLWVVKGFFVGGKKASVYIDTQSLIPINFLLNGAWILAFTQEKILLSTVIILLLLLSLILIYRKIKLNVNRGIFDLVPFSIYLGWVSIASIVNIFTYFVRNDFHTFLGFNELGWTVIILIFGCALAASFSLINQDALYSIVFIWSYIAINIKNQTEIINLITLICIVIMSVVVLNVVISKVSKTK